MLHHAKLLWSRWGSRWGTDIHLFMSLEQMFPSFRACICREHAACLSREMAICVTELVQCVANKTCAVLHPGGLAFFFSSLVVSVDLTKALKQKACGCSKCEKHTVAVVSGRCSCWSSAVGTPRPRCCHSSASISDLKKESLTY